MEEQLNYEIIPGFDKIQTLMDLNSNDLEKQTTALYSLTYYSDDYRLILTTLEKFIRNEKWELRFYADLCG